MKLVCRKHGIRFLFLLVMMVNLCIAQVVIEEELVISPNDKNNKTIKDNVKIEPQYRIKSEGFISTLIMQSSINSNNIFDVGDTASFTFPAVKTFLPEKYKIHRAVLDVVSDGFVLYPGGQGYPPHIQYNTSINGIDCGQLNIIGQHC